MKLLPVIIHIQWNLGNNKKRKKTNDDLWKVFVCFENGEDDDTYKKMERNSTKI